jgi:hypothetical protein
MRASTLLSWVALWALGFVRASVRARTGGCGSGSSLTNPVSEAYWTKSDSSHAVVNLFLHLLYSKLAVKLIKGINAGAFVHLCRSILWNSLSHLVTSLSILWNYLSHLVTYLILEYILWHLWSWNHSCDIRNTVCFHTCFFALPLNRKIVIGSKFTIPLVTLCFVQMALFLILLWIDHQAAKHLIQAWWLFQGWSLLISTNVEEIQYILCVGKVLAFVQTSDMQHYLQILMTVE